MLPSINLKEYEEKCRPKLSLPLADRRTQVQSPQHTLTVLVSPQERCTLIQSPKIISDIWGSLLNISNNEKITR